MITVKEIDKVLSQAAPCALSEEWDNDGVMLCENPNKPVKKALVMLEVTPDGITAAEKGGYDLIVTHHPFVFRPFKCLTGSDYTNFSRLMQKNIAVLSYHTRLDSALGGVNDTAAELLHLSEVTPFGGENGQCGRIGSLPEPLTSEAFAAVLKETFGSTSVRASFFKTPDKKIRRVAFVGGAGKSFFYDAYAAGADAFVTGEAAHNTFLDCKELDMCLFDLGHYFTENPVCERIKKLLFDAFGAELAVDTFDVQSPYISL